MPLKKRIGPTPEALELARILQLPVHGMMELEELEMFSYEHLLATAYDRGDRFKLQQATAIRSYIEEGGSFLPLAVGKGKCICGSVEVNDLTTGRRSVAELGPVSVDSMDEETGQFHTRQASAFESGNKDCLRLSLAGGQQIELSTDHPVFTQDGWVEAGELQHDDLVATPRRLPEPSDPCGVPDNDVKLLAYLLADGCLVGSHCDFVDDCPETLSEVKNLARAKGWSVTNIPQTSKASGLAFGNGAREWVREWAIDAKSINKRLPAALYNLPSRQCALFLNRFWACDGHVASSHLECTLASHGLIRDLRYLLLRLGILCRVSYKKAKCNGKDFDAWRLTIFANEASKFLEIIGTPPGQEDRVLEFFERRRGVKNNPNTDIVPFGMPEFKKLCDELGIQGRGGCWRKRAESTLPSRGQLKKFLGVTEGQWISRTKWESFVNTHNYTGKYAWLATNDLSWERVDSIKSIGEQPVYDLSVDVDHNFVANGIVVHNTGVSIFCANWAHVQGFRKTLLIMPVQNIGSLHTRHIPEWRRRINLSVPFHNLAGRPPETRRAMARNDSPGCYVMPFSLLSRDDTLEVLDLISPELIVVDEVHNLRRTNVARTKAIMTYLRDVGPQFVAMSGTITQKSLIDYQHLISASLGDGSPLPRTGSMAKSWDLTLNAAAEEPTPEGTKLMRPLLDWARDLTGEPYDPREVRSYRTAFRHRLNSAPGEVVSDATELGVSLDLRDLPVPDYKQHPDWPKLEKLLQDVEKFTTPQGEQIAHAFHRYKWNMELSAGFYNLLEWPTPQDVMKTRSVSKEKAEDALEGARVHHAAQQNYYSWLRKFFKKSPAGLDTPRRIGRSLASKKPDSRIPNEVRDAWATAHDIKDAVEEKFGFLVERKGRPVRVCDYKIRHAVEWAKENKKGIMWVWHQEVGRWLYEALEEAGLDPIYCPAGEKYNRLIESIGDAQMGGKGDRLVVASLVAHGTGKNLQAFNRAFFMQWPRSGKDAEQTIGRIHRDGQEADEVDIYTNITLEFDSLIRSACLNDSIYVQATTGAPRKVVFGNYETLPKIYPEDFLREQGIENVKALNVEGRQLRNENFGDPKKSGVIIPQLR